MDRVRIALSYTTYISTHVQTIDNICCNEVASTDQLSVGERNAISLSRLPVGVHCLLSEGHYPTRGCTVDPSINFSSFPDSKQYCVATNHAKKAGQYNYSIYMVYCVHFTFIHQITFYHNNKLFKKVILKKEKKNNRFSIYNSKS